MIASPDAVRKVEILLIEDQPADGRMVSLALKGFDISHTLRIIEDGESALAFLKNKDALLGAQRPDIVLLDWKLPGKNGVEVLKEMRKDPDLSDLPVVVLTGYDSEELSRDVYAAGANLFIQKPETLYRYTMVLRFVIEAFQKGKLNPPIG